MAYRESKSSVKIIKLLKALLGGEDLNIKRVQEITGLQRNQARRYIGAIEKEFPVVQMKFGRELYWRLGDDGLKKLTGKTEEDLQ